MDLGRPWRKTNLSCPAKNTSFSKTKQTEAVTLSAQSSSSSNLPTPSLKPPILHEAPPLCCPLVRFVGGGTEGRCIGHRQTKHYRPAAWSPREQRKIGDELHPPFEAFRHGSPRL
ncbi:hypothetical protein GWI33_021128 [Rhynchophorus ferrugineus]|uniref:Uncharacterized protein n=1 Tax=Rhynchophorus ferrugineus TaxID=354439 RepID=A0A834HQA0_RHYFE|nr:hypothetical protein GWI33_021128 [Rhynchophorus ferrugineus]